MPTIRKFVRQCINIISGGVLGAALLSASIGKVQAQEINPNSFLPLPSGTNLLLGYYVYGHKTDYTVRHGPTFSENTGLESNIGVARYVHYFEVAGHPAAVQILQFFGSLSGGQVNGKSTGSAFGTQNTVLSALFWPYADFKRKFYINLTGWIFPPDGSYDRHSSLNVGDGRLRGDIQLGIDKAVGTHFSITAAFDAMLYGDNDNAFAGAASKPARLSQDNTYRGQIFLNWNFNRSLQTAIGWEGFFGGVQRLNGKLTGGATNEQRIRATVSKFLTPAVQVLLEANHDLTVSGGYKQDFGLTARVLYAF
jgi:Putative MetA-pathway of phenol degradation